MTTTELRDWSGQYPRGAVEAAIIALEAARPDTKEGRAVRRAVDDALDRLYLYHAQALNESAVGGEE